MASETSCKPREFQFPGLAVFFVSFSILLFEALSPSVHSGDSGMISFASFFLGTAHPPGYPLFVLLGKLFTFIPFGSVAFKVNVSAAAFGAATAFLAYETALHLTKNPFASLFAPLVAVAAPNFILQSSIAKGGIYTLNSFFVILIFYIGLKSLEGKDSFRNFLLASFLFGVATANHHTIGLMLFPLIYVFIVRRRELPFRTAAISLLLFIAGFATYLYLYVRTVAHPLIVYSMVSSFPDFLAVLLRKGYSTPTIRSLESVASSTHGWFYAAKNMVELLSKAFHPVVWILIVFGLAVMVKERKTFWYIFIAVMAWLILGRVALPQAKPSAAAIDIVTPYFTGLIPLLGIVAAIGISGIYMKLKTHSSAVSVFFVGGLLVFQGIFVPIGFQKSSLSDNFIAYDWIWDVSKVLKPESSYLAFGDNPCFLSLYGFGVERMRDDALCIIGDPTGRSFRLILAPKRKYSMLYPGFYEGQTSPVSYFYPLAKRGRFFASRKASIPPGMRDKFDARPYVLTAMLLSKGSNLPFDKMFNEDFQKIDYLPVVFAKDTDNLTAESQDDYIFTIRRYARILAAANEKDADYFFKLSILLAGGKIKLDLIHSYADFLAARRGLREAENFLSEMKKTAPKQDVEKVQDIQLSVEQAHGSIGNSGPQ